jgi:hypothetical protein
MRTKLTWLITSLAAVGLVACAGTTDEGNQTNDKPGVDASAFEASGKGDFAARADVIDDIALDTTVEGTFDPRVRNYGYTFEAKKGAELTIDLTATAGDDARGLEEGATLDTVMALYKGYEGSGEIGEQIRESDDGEDTVAAPSISFEVPQSGKYFLAFTSYQDTGTGQYSVELGCNGTDFQCQRPDYEKPCKKEEMYIRGGTIEKDTTWNACKTVLMETAKVAEGATLTIRPGVTVHGNFLNPDNSGQGYYGVVTLDIRGTLQAAGTEEDPIAFTALKDRGWGGIELRGESSTLEHVFIERANVGVKLDGAKNASIRHAVIEGTAKLEDNSQRGSQGIWADREATAEFSHSLVKGYNKGVYARNNDGLVVKDSVIRDNHDGVYLEGDSDLRDHEIRRCEDGSNNETPRDPVFEHVDILENDRWGIRIEGDNIFLQVEKSNLINNGDVGLSLLGVELAGNSFLNNNNIHGNNGANDQENAPQIRAYHRNTVELEENFWGFISDPQLSKSWDLQCSNEGGDISFTGFAPEPIADAGPRADEIRDEVEQESWAQQKQQDG